MKGSRLIGSLVLMAAVVAASPVQAQDAEVDYEARFTELHRAFACNPHDVETLYQLTLFYFDNSNPLRDLPTAFDYARLTEASHADLLLRDRVRDLVQLQRKGITLSSIRELRQAIASAAFEGVRLHNDLQMAEVDNYLNHFGDNAEMVKLLRTRRYKLVFDELLARGSVADCYSFMLTYPGTAEAGLLADRIGRQAAAAIAAAPSSKAVDSLVDLFPPVPAVRLAADRRQAHLAFLAAEADGSLDAYRAFLVRFPASDESELARNRIDRLLETDLARRSSPIELAHFADSNADLDIADRALARLRHLIYSRRDAQAAQYYVDHFKLDSYYSEVYSRFYSWHAVEGNAAPLHRFSDANPDFPFPHALEDDLERASDIDLVPLLADYEESAYDNYASYIRHMMGKAIAVVPLQRMLQPLLDANRYDDALFRIEQFEICFDNQFRWQYDALRRLVSTPSEYKRKEESKRDAGGIPGRGCEGAKRKEESGERRVEKGEDGEVVIAEFDGERWRVSDIPPYPVNTDYVETDGFLLPDGSGMLLASDRPGGFNLQPSGANFHGDTALATDLWFIPCTAGRWGEPVNLGPQVNTPYAERYPILSRNLTTLYFVSDGHAGLGYGDIYVAERTDPSDWTSWSEPRNLGRDVNSPFREGHLALSADERRLFFTSRGKNYSVATSHDNAAAGARLHLPLGPLASSMVRLYVADVDRQSVTQVMESGEWKSDNGVDVTMRSDRRYALLADAGTRFVTAALVDPGQVGDYRLPAYSFEELVAMDRPLPLPVVQFSALGADLLPVAQLQLEQLARFLASRPDAVAELLVDLPGPDAAFCYRLALARCEAVRLFLTQRGAAAANLLLSPYGNARCGAAPRGLDAPQPEGLSVRFRQR